MVPVYNEVNRIQVGNPVPIGSSESERAFSEAEDALGKSIFDLGNALYKKEKEDEEQWRIPADIAASNLSVYRKQKEQELRTTFPMIESDGVNFSKKVEEEVAPYKQQLLESLHPNSRLYFEQYAATDLKHQIGSYLKTGVDGHNEAAKAQFNELFLAKNRQAMTDPSTLPVRLIEIEIAIEESNTPESEKKKLIQEKQAAAVLSVVDKFRNDGKEGDLSAFGSAKKLLEQHASILDSAKMGDSYKEMINEEYTTVGRDRENSDYMYKIKERNEKEIKAKNYRIISDKLKNAKTPVDTLKVIAEANKLKSADLLDANQLNDAINGRQQIVEIGDDLFQSGVMNQLMKENGAFVVPKGKSAVQKINEAYSANKISPDRHAKLLAMAENLREHGVSKERQLEIAKYSAIFDSITKPTVTKPGEEAFAEQRQILARTLSAQFTEAALKDPNASVQKLFNKYMSKYDLAYTIPETSKFIPNTPQMFQATPEARKEAKPMLIDNLIRAQKSGDKTQIRRAQDALKKYLEVEKSSQIPKEK
mgnify:FL=1